MADNINEVLAGIESTCENCNQHEEDKDAQENYEKVQAQAADVLTKCNQLIINITTKLCDGELSVEEEVVKFSVFTYILSAQQAGSGAWTNSANMRLAGKTLTNLCQMLRCENIECVLRGGGGKGIVGDVVSYMMPKLKRETWKQHPAYMQLYHYTLLHLKFPHLKDYVAAFLPPALLLVDDWEEENKLKGLQCIIHILHNVGVHELITYGRLSVIHEALKHLLYIKQVDIVEALHPPLLIVINALHRENKDKHMLLHLGVMDELLLHMSCEDKWVLRRVYSAHLYHYIESMGERVLFYGGKIPHMLGEYLQTADPDNEITRINTMKALLCWMQQASARLPHHCTTLLCIIIRLMYDVTCHDVTTHDVTAEDTLISLSVQAILLLKSSAPGQTCKHLQAVQRVDKFTGLPWHKLTLK